MRIVFMGTPAFAVEPLRALVEAGHDIAAVVTVPDRKAGRGQQVQESDVKKYALEQGYTILQPEKLRDPEFIEALKSLDADVFVVVAFRMLPEAVFTIPSKGTINIHASLLPDYRGAAPINHAIINGEPKTGVTTFIINKEIDTGNILMQQEVEISTTDTAGTLHDKLMVAGAKLIIETLQALNNNSIHPEPQKLTGLERPAPKIFREDCRIDFAQPAGKVASFIRGLSPYPAAFTDTSGVSLKIYSVTEEECFTGVEPGTVLTDGKTYLGFACREGCVLVSELQPAGKKRMPVGDYLRGAKVTGVTLDRASMTQQE